MGHAIPHSNLHIVVSSLTMDASYSIWTVEEVGCPLGAQVATANLNTIVTEQLHIVAGCAKTTWLVRCSIPDPLLSII
ncbi:hypothetical protein N7499_011404 [Penicillium canescens]|uniref:Uncharacterized protein n=1 Tax=Penicillium canescens TaxID=5083 RepID=A0AAD6NCP4_PENCN|nr:uncharacterized protein N7446_006658 [Penicillium canescens]KAJ5990856.1 hypothetical protein N7522_011063 [Penicillium canescens]KAJ6050014.1 hypothetical protein N7444_006730 [Penicillium canescens]KAJ6052019.1 hypothetical protein N7460_002553 [Penicillium canescens]KAJ6062538.1 hypothetical protein N7446_006658 [Penicillium canescens]KAJ6069517.1 hypothetical protein N7499_011404 [Penicillium canescens]